MMKLVLLSLAAALMIMWGAISFEIGWAAAEHNTPLPTFDERFGNWHYIPIPTIPLSPWVQRSVVV